MVANPVSKSQTTIAELMMPEHANPAGNVFGGEIMSLIDKAALICASRHTHLNCVTASIDRLDFISPVFVGNVVFAKASINYVSNKSMEIGVRVEAECLVSGQHIHVASAYLTYVALDKNDKPIIIPKLILENEIQKKRYQDAIERREKRIKKFRESQPETPCMVRIEK